MRLFYPVRVFQPNQDNPSPQDFLKVLEMVESSPRTVIRRETSSFDLGKKLGEKILTYANEHGLRPEFALSYSPPVDRIFQDKKVFRVEGLSEESRSFEFGLEAVYLGTD